MGEPRRLEVTAAQRRRTVFALRAEGQTLEQIAERVGVSRETVRRDLGHPGRAARTKGGAFERDVRKQLEAAGYFVRKLDGAGDFLALRDGERPKMGECKRQERWQVPEWIAQAEADAGENDWLLICKRSNRPAYVIQPLEQYLRTEEE